MSEKESTHRRDALSEAHGELGAALREARRALGRSTRQIPGYTSGHISNVENGYVTPSDDIIAAYASVGADPEPLTGLLAAARAASSRSKLARLRTAGGRGGGSSALTEDSPIQEIRSRYEFDELEVVVRYDARRVMIDVNVIATIRAVVAPVTLVAFAARYLADPRPEVVGLSPLFGCEIVRQTTSASGAVSAVAKLHHSIERPDGATSRYGYHVAVTSSTPAEPLLRELSPKLRRRQSYRLQFTPPALPQKIWQFRTLDLIDAVGEPTEDQVLDIHPSGFITCDFYGVAEEMLGVAWEW